MKNIVSIPVTISRANIDGLHALRAAAGLEPVSDAVLVQIVFSAGCQAEVADLERLAEQEQEAA